MHQWTVAYSSIPGFTAATGCQGEGSAKLNMVKPSVWWVSGDCVTRSNLFGEQLPVCDKDFVESQF